MYSWKMDAESVVPLTEQLYAQIRQDIESGALEQETRLPARRQMVEMLGISATTVENALGRLLEEGYVQSRPRSGLYVAQGKRKTDREAASAVPVRWDFGTGVMDARQFPDLSSQCGNDVIRRIDGN